MLTWLHNWFDVAGAEDFLRRFLLFFDGNFRIFVAD